MTITDFCEEINNFFETEKYIGNFAIENGRVVLPVSINLQNNQYFRIVGSVFNDGVYKHPENGLTDETFIGAVWAMAVPPAAIALFEKINNWDVKYSQDETANSPYQSESFGGYSYTKGGSSGANGSSNIADWRTQFKNPLRKWRKLR